MTHDSTAETSTSFTPGPNASGLAALEVLFSRSSNNMLTDPAPEGAHLDLILQAASRAPDHGRLCPWRFVLIRGAARENFARLLKEAAVSRQPEIEAGKLSKIERMCQSPLIIAVGTDFKESKFPKSEQELSVAAAAMNVLNAVHALGYAGKWVTGDNSHDPAVHAALGFEAPNRVLGFLLIGTARMALPEVERPSVEDSAEDWTPPTPR
ncbi:MAG TPA: nitroreductase [Alphaproteobacteria bacterium]|nr:nitroreductase [Alphaproteobacteria bacterium]